jgi:hypothetical protein
MAPGLHVARFRKKTKMVFEISKKIGTKILDVDDNEFY